VEQYKTQKSLCIKRIFFISDGDITPLIDDLIEAGADGFMIEPFVDLKWLTTKYGKDRDCSNKTDDSIEKVKKRCLENRELSHLSHTAIGPNSCIQKLLRNRSYNNSFGSGLSVLAYKRMINFDNSKWDKTVRNQVER